MRKVILRKVLREGERLPKWYGFAYMTNFQIVAYPIPINLVVNFYKRIQEAIIKPPLPQYEKELFAAYQKGLRDGVKLMQEQMKKTMEEFLKN